MSLSLSALNLHILQRIRTMINRLFEIINDLGLLITCIIVFSVISHTIGLIV